MAHRLTIALALGALCGSYAACKSPQPRRNPPPPLPDDSARAVPTNADAGPSAVPAAPTPPPAPTTLAEIGLDADAMDQSADPCKDFFQYACGGWTARATARPGRSALSRADERAEQLTADLRAILEDARKAPATSQPQALLGRFYGTCMDESRIAQTGLADLAELLGAAAALPDGRDYPRVLATLHRQAIFAGFSWRVEREPSGDRRYHFVVGDGSLGLPSRRHYLGADKGAERVRRRYRDHVQRVFELTGDKRKRARRAAARVLALEIELARVAATPAARRRTGTWRQTLTLAELSELPGKFDWSSYLQTLGRADIAQVSISSREQLISLGALMRKSKTESWRDYLRWRILDGMTPTLPAEFATARAEFSSALGAAQAPTTERWKHCVRATDTALGWSLARLYVAERFTNERLAGAREVVGALRSALSARIPELTWMSASAKERARTKVQGMALELGRPPDWSTFDLNDLIRRLPKDAGLASIWLAAHSWAVDRALARVGKPGAEVRPDWRTYPHRIDGYYDPRDNVLVASAGLLHAPFFAPEHTRAVNLGALALLVGHELIHSVDDLGAGYDQTGAAAPWWTEADSRAYRGRAQCVARAHYGPAPTTVKPLVRTHSLREDIADIGGLTIAWRALTSSESASAPGGATGATSEARTGALAEGSVAGLTRSQQFFVAAAQAVCETAATDGAQPPVWGRRTMGRARINRAVTQVTGFGQSFQCPAPATPAPVCGIW